MRKFDNTFFEINYFYGIFLNMIELLSRAGSRWNNFMLHF